MGPWESEAAAVSLLGETHRAVQRAAQGQCVSLSVGIKEARQHEQTGTRGHQPGALMRLPGL